MIFFFKKDPIDCQIDPCHLVWLIYDERNLLKAIMDGSTCSNGIPLKNLNPNVFKDCQVYSKNI